MLAGQGDFFQNGVLAPPFTPLLQVNAPPAPLTLRNPLSAITITVFEDLGYRVNLAAASSYTRTFTARALAGGPLIDLGNDVIVAPAVRFVDDGPPSRVRRR